MGNLSKLREAVDPNYAYLQGTKRKRDASALTEAFSEGMTKAVKPALESLEAVQKAISAQVKELEAKPSLQADEMLTPLKDLLSMVMLSIEVIPEPKDYTDQFEALETMLRAEIQALPKPGKAVDLQPVMEAIKGIIVEPVVVEKMVERPAEPIKKTTWTFDIIRNKRTGLLEKVVAS